MCLFTGNLMQVLIVHILCILLHPISVAQQGPDSWRWV